MTKSTCTADDCGRDVYGHGMCSKHYQRAKRRGELPSSKPCTIEGCNSALRAHGYCGMHLQRWERTGDPLNAGAYERHDDVESSFWARVKQSSNGCLEYVGSDNGSGYGTMSHNGSRVYAHRYAWERVNGTIPDGLFIDHMCHNRRCCNVEHLRLATNKQNLENRAGPQKNNFSSGVRGVTFHKGTRKWVAQMGHDGQSVYVGLYETIAEAEAAVTARRNELFTHNMD